MVRLLPRAALLLGLVAVACGPSPSPAVPSPTARSAGRVREVPLASEVGVDSAALGRRAPVLPDLLAGDDAVRVAELARSAAAVVDAFENVDARFTPDGRRIVYRSNRDGLWQAYAADPKRPEDFPVRLVQTGEPVSFAEPTLDAGALLFLSERAVDGRTVVSRALLPKRPKPGLPSSLDVLAPTVLASGEVLALDSPFLRGGKGAPMIVFARSPSEATTGIYVQATALAAALRLVLREPSSSVLADVDHVGKHALLVRRPSRSDASVVVCDLDKGATRVLYPPEGATANVLSAAYSADARTVFVITAGGSEDSLLLALDAATGVERARYVEVGARGGSLRSIAVAPRGDRLAVEVVAGGQVELRSLDAKNFAPGAAVALPFGRGRLGRFSPDGRRVTVSWSTPDAPTNVFSVDARTGVVKRLRDEARPSLALLPPIESSIEHVASLDGAALPVEVHRPASGGARAVLVLARSGSAPSLLGWSPFVRFFTGQGFAVVELNVGGAAAGGRADEHSLEGPSRPDRVGALEAVGRWAARQSWADPKRLVVMGDGAGAAIVLTSLARGGELWQAGVVLDSTSPFADAAAIRAPLFVYQGRPGEHVARSESDELVRALRGRGASVEYMLASGEGRPREHRAREVERLARVAYFLERALRPASAP